MDKWNKNIAIYKILVIALIGTFATLVPFYVIKAE